MRILSKYLTPPLAPSDRWAFYNACGLRPLSYLYVETGEKHVFSAKRVDGNLLTPFVEPRFPDRIASWAAKLGLPVICVCNAGSNLPTYSLFAEQSLWEALFPYPFSAIGITSPDNTVATEAFPLAFSSRLDHLQKVVHLLETVASNFEVSLLWIKAADGEAFPLLFHYVRRKRIRVGTSPMLIELGKRYESGGKNPRDLSDSFGTRCQWLPVDLSTARADDPVENLAITLEEALTPRLSPSVPRDRSALAEGPRPEIRL